VIDEFRAAASVTYLDELTEDIILRWYASLRKRGNSDRTINNKHVSLFGFLRWAGVDTKKLAARAPKYTEKSVEVYNTEQLKTFFASPSVPYHLIVFNVLLKTGLRMQEAIFLEGHDIDFTRGTVTVSEKDDLGFVIKGYKLLHGSYYFTGSPKKSSIRKGDPRISHLSKPITRYTEPLPPPVRGACSASSTPKACGTVDQPVFDGWAVTRSRPQNRPMKNV
jgi:integrase